MKKSDFMIIINESKSAFVAMKNRARKQADVAEKSSYFHLLTRVVLQLIYFTEAFQQPNTQIR